MRELICIACPKGCLLAVDDELNVSGHSCERGAAYGKAEVLNPMRAATSTVRVIGGIHRRCPVKTNGSIPKGLVPEAVKALSSVSVQIPIRMGQAILPDVCGSGVDFVATRSMG
jgi:CxxC motif-containing protein